MKSWGLACISLGCISIMTSPVHSVNNTGMVLQGIVLVVIGGLMWKKKDKKGAANEKGNHT